MAAKLKSRILLSSMLMLGLLGGATMTAAGDSGTGLKIEVRRGPISPVTRIGMDNSAPMANARVKVRDLSRREVAQTVTNAKGLSTLLLAPGTYELVVTNCDGIRAGESEPVEATVKANALTAVRIECDTGIR